MKRINRRLWNIVPPTVRGKVGRLWGDKGATEAYLGELYQSTLDSRETIRKAVVATEGSSGWGNPRVEADTDLARVYAFAAWCVSRTHNLSDFEWALSGMTLGQLSEILVAQDGWSEQSMSDAWEELKRTQVVEGNLRLCVSIDISKERQEKTYLSAPGGTDYLALGKILHEIGLTRAYPGDSSFRELPQICVIGVAATKPRSGQVASVRIAESYVMPPAMDLSEFQDVLEEHGFEENYSMISALGELDLRIH